jgi:hypothetical protein
MASQAVRTRIVVEGPSGRVNTFGATGSEGEALALNVALTAARPDPRVKRVVFALLALLAFVACVSIHHDAQASALGFATSADVAQDGDDQVLDSAAPESAHYRQNNDAPPPGELKALEPEDTEQDVGLDTLAVCLSACFAPLLPLATQTLGLVFVAWTAEFSLSSALARGPPHPSR